MKEESEVKLVVAIAVTTHDIERIELGINRSLVQPKNYADTLCYDRNIMFEAGGWNKDESYGI